MSRATAASLGKMPTTSLRRLTSPFEAFQPICAVKLHAILGGEAQEGRHVCLAIILRERGADSGGDDTTLGLAAILTSFPDSARHVADRRPQPVMGVGDDQVDAAQAAPSQAMQELGPAGLGLAVADRDGQHIPPAIDIDGRRRRSPPRSARHLDPLRLCIVRRSKCFSRQRCGDDAPNHHSLH